jgi:RimJ/RimL family protein N-acetyltransferase
MALKLETVTHIETRDGEKLAVRRLRKSDAEALKRFNRELTPPSRRWFLPHPYDDNTVTKALQRSEQGRDLTLGLFDGSRIVGYFFLWYFDRPVPLLGIGLVDDFHGRGLARPMMNLLIREAEKAGKDAIELTTMMDNERAYALYEKVGFEHYKDVENLQGNGQWVVERAMIYRIKPDAQPMTEPHQPPV